MHAIDKVKSLSTGFGYHFEDSNEIQDPVLKKSINKLVSESLIPFKPTVRAWKLMFDMATNMKKRDDMKNPMAKPFLARNAVALLPVTGQIALLGLDATVTIARKIRASKG